MKTYTPDRIEEYLRCSEDREAADIIAQMQAENARLLAALEEVGPAAVAFARSALDSGSRPKPINSAGLRGAAKDAWLEQEQILAALAGKE